WGLWRATIDKILVYFFPDNSTGVIAENDIAPREFILYQNYPNPFNPNTVISYRLSVNSNVIIKVYDVLGNEITTLVDEDKEPGNYEVEFNTSSINHQTSSGIYFCQLRAGNFLETKKMLLLK
ncbi:MAG: T9SS type A sorting domain-containing protein, partial [Ignavibacteriales bacterium]